MQFILQTATSSYMTQHIPTIVVMTTDIEVWTHTIYLCDITWCHMAPFKGKVFTHKNKVSVFINYLQGTKEWALEDFKEPIMSYLLNTSFEGLTYIIRFFLGEHLPKQHSVRPHIHLFRARFMTQHLWRHPGNSACKCHVSTLVSNGTTGSKVRNFDRVIVTH